MQNNNKYYIYVYLDPRKPGQFIYKDISFLFEPIYVGKGCGKRYLTHLAKCTNISFKDTLAAILNAGFSQKNYIVKIKNNLLEQEAFSSEQDLIKQIGCCSSNTGPLINGYLRPYKYSITIQTKGAGTLHCLRALSRFAQKTENINTPCKGTNEIFWKENNYCATFRFTCPTYRNNFIKQIFLELKKDCKEITRSDNNILI